MYAPKFDSSDNSCVQENTNKHTQRNKKIAFKTTDNSSTQLTSKYLIIAARELMACFRSTSAGKYTEHSHDVL